MSLNVSNTSTTSTNAMATAGSSIISSLGGGSGINTSELTDQLANISSQLEAQKLDSRKTTLETQISDYGKLRSALSTFQGSAAALGSADTFNAKSVSIPTTTQLSITALKSDAASGNYSLQVQQVAQAQSVVSGASFASINDAVGEGTLELKLGNWTGGTFAINEKKAGGTITIDETNNTLGGLRDAINNAGLGVNASIVNDGSGFRLMLNAQTGENNEIALVATETAAKPGLAAFNFNESLQNMQQQQEGRDAKISVNGLVVSRETNRITDVVQGLEFDVFSANLTESVSISISQDKNAGEQAIRDFVAAYNTLIADVGKLIGYDSELEANGSLKSDPLAKNLMSVLRSTLATPISGGSDLFSTLGAIGIRTKSDGTLEINENPSEPNTNFRAAIDKNYDAVRNLFVPKASSSNASVEVSKTSSLTQAGTYDVQITQQPSKGSLTTGQFNGPIDSAGKDYSFEFILDDVTTNPIAVVGTFNTPDELAVYLQSAINTDAKVRAAMGTVAVSFSNNQFVFTSEAYGSSSKVGFANMSADAQADFGFADGIGSAGVDIGGTINGVAGFGFGNVLLANYGSDADGLSLIIQPGVTQASVSFSRGLAGSVNNLIGTYLSNSGLIADREESLSKGVEKVNETKEAMTRRTEAYRARLQSQFIAMENIVRSLNSTGDMLEGLSDRLPFTSKK